MAADSSRDFGARLRDARESRGMSLRQVAHATKISAVVLEALEANDVSRLPGGIFSRAFVRSYASEVGLDPDATLTDFINRFPAHPLGAVAAIPADRSVARHRGRSRAGMVVAGIAVSVAVATALRYIAVARTDQVRRSSATQSPAARSVAAATVADTGVVAPVQPAVGSVVPSGQLTVLLSVERPSWVSVVVDDQPTIDRMLEPGEQQTIEVSREMVVTGSDAAALHLTLNGAASRVLGDRGQRVTARFGPANYKDFVQSR
jgi:cytoskeleton protein RodZ